MKTMTLWKVAVLVSLGLAACIVPALEEFDHEKARDCDTEHSCLSGFGCVEGHCQPEEGTACQPGSTVSCGLEAGECQPGSRTCGEKGTYGPCVGALVASSEVCNGKDDDCDGIVDEDLPCGDSGTPLALGEPCAESASCGSGFCVDGYCCDKACTGACERCGATPGTCSPAGDGSPGEPVCTPYLCDGAGGGCPSRCETNADCAAGVLCVGNVCGDKLPRGAACTLSGQCFSGHCVDGSCCGDASCATPPGQCYAAAGSCASGTCSYTAKAAGTACNDGNPGTFGDACNGSGTCAGTTSACNTPPNTQCYNPAGSWDGSKCVYTPKTTDTSCNDGNACTTGDVCNGSGTCGGGSTLVCNAPPGQCYQPTGTCTSAGGCTYAFKSSDFTCDDGNPCTIGDRCNGSGACKGTTLSCNNPPSQCHQPTGTCTNGACTYAFKTPGSACNDGDNCTIGEVCGGNGTCGGGSVCVTPNQCQTGPGTCVAGVCNYSPKNGGTYCSDNDACTSEACNGMGACTVYYQTQCSDYNTACDPTTGYCQE